MEFQLLGPLRATDDSRRLELGGSKQQRVLTALLLARGGVVSTDRLVDLVWGHAPPSKPNVTLRSYISHLRRVLEPRREAGGRATTLVTRAPGYALEIDPSQNDLIRFERAVSDARGHLTLDRLTQALEALTAGLDLWRGTQLAEGLLEPSDPVVVEASELRLGALELQQELLLRLGRHEEALPTLEGMLAADPLREGVRRLHMLALYRSGRTADALASFQAGRNATVEELGLEPSTNLRELEAAILDDDASLQWEARATQVATGAREDPDQLASAPTGRKHEAERLSACLSSSLAGSATLAVLTGEPGIGKTTLLQHSLEQAGRRGFRTSIGRCHDGAAALPLSPWMGVLEELTGELEAAELEQIVGEADAAVRQLLPGHGSTSGSGADELGTDVDQQTLFRAVVRTLRRLADRSPLTLAFEDLHWADPTTVRLLSFAATELATSPVHLIATWRDTEVVTDELAQGLAEVGRAAGDGRLGLSGLGPEDSQQLYAELFDGELSLEAASQIVDQTSGNPLFLTELLRSLATTGGLEPTDTIRDVLSRRISQLPEGSEVALTIGALSPGGFTEHLLAAVNGASPDETLDVLEAALAARLIEEDPDSPEQFRFTHAVIAETLTSTLSGPRRARYHAAIGAELERRGAPVELLAHHFLRGARAGTSHDGAEYAHRAGVEAMRLWDYTGASDLLETGLEVLSQSGEVDKPLEADLLIDLMQVRKHQERAIDAQALGIEAFDVAEEAGDAERMAIAALVYSGWPRPTGGRQRDQWLGYWCPAGPAIAMLSACVDKVPSDHWLRGGVLIGLGTQHFGEYEDLLYCAEVFAEAEAHTVEHDDPDLLAAVLQSTYQTFQRVSTLEARQALLERIISISTRRGLLDRGVSARRSRLVLYLEQLDPAGAANEAQNLADIARGADDPLLSLYAEVAKISLRLLRGDLDEAETLILSALDTYAQLGSATLDQVGLQLAVVSRERGRLDDVVEMLRWKLAGYPGPAFAAPLASTLVTLGRDDEARELISEFSQRAIALGGEGVLQYITPCFFAEAVCDLDDTERAGWIYDGLQGAEGRLIAMFDGVATYGCGSYYLGRLATTLGAYDDAAHHFDVADQVHEALGARPYELRTLLARAQLEHRQGRSTAPYFEPAEALAAELGMEWLCQAARITS